LAVQITSPDVFNASWAGVKNPCGCTFAETPLYAIKASPGSDNGQVMRAWHYSA